jgi:uncharacterized protein (TIGR03435 family)
MTNLASGLARLVPGLDRVVIDRTGLRGTFDVDLKWSFEGTAEHLGIQLPPPDHNQPTLFVALQEQVGLKLESTKAPVDVVLRAICSAIPAISALKTKKRRPEGGL